ncbi:MAG TPA: hypothetical protein VFN92_00520 [Solirubrobacterales bacterium]|nr:hypothetical protein [Solirubrobacterales bacterium]
MKLSRAALAALFTFTGTMHFVRPRFFEAIVPPAIESRKQDAVAVSGVAEIAGAALLLHPASRRIGRWWLLALLVAVFPANVHMAVNPEQIRGLDMRKFPRWALWARLPLQPLAMIWVWHTTRPK